MGMYDPLETFLSNHVDDECVLTRADIEKIIRKPLPPNREDYADSGGVTRGLVHTSKPIAGCMLDGRSPMAASPREDVSVSSGPSRPVHLSTSIRRYEAPKCSCSLPFHPWLDAPLSSDWWMWLPILPREMDHGISRGSATCARPVAWKSYLRSARRSRRRSKAKQGREQHEVGERDSVVNRAYTE